MSNDQIEPELSTVFLPYSFDGDQNIYLSTVSPSQYEQIVNNPQLPDATMYRTTTLIPHPNSAFRPITTSTPSDYIPHPNPAFSPITTSTPSVSRSSSSISNTSSSSVSKCSKKNCPVKKKKRPVKKTKPKRTRLFNKEEYQLVTNKKKIPNKVCRHLISHCSKKHPLPGDELNYLPILYVDEAGF